MKSIHTGAAVLLLLVVSLMGAGPVGAATGPYLVKNINTSGDSNPRELTAFNGNVFFSAKGGQGRELWMSDGTSQGTRRVKDIWPGSHGSGPRGLTVAGGFLFFAADDGVHGFELWATDGTNAGTRRLSDINPGMGSSVGEDLVPVGNLLYFFAFNSTVGLRQLWKSDGTPGGTNLVKQLPEGAILDGGEIGFQGKLYFALDICGGDVCSGEGLWRSNGTAAGTRQFFTSSDENASYPNQLTRSGGFLYWNDGGTLYRTKGTMASTKSLGNLGPDGLANVEGTLFFGRTDALWKSNGTLAGTVLVEALPSNPFLSTPVGNRLFFVTVADTWQTLWASNGTAIGTNPLLTVDQYARFDSFTDVNGTLYFVVNEGLHRSDGSVGGTESVTVSGMGEAEQLTNVGGTLFFTNDVGNAGRELWRYVP